MTASPSVRSARQRYFALLGLRWVSTGLYITVFVLLMRDRGLTLAQIGLATAAQGFVMLFLELPSGGLADAWGRKRVLVVAAAVGLAASGLVLLADTVILLALASALQGVFRALDSGPLEAWFVDRVVAADPDIELERELGWGEVVICAAIGSGALVAGLIVGLDGAVGIDPLVLPLLVGLVVQLVGLVALVLLLDEEGAGTATTGTSAADGRALAATGEQERVGVRAVAAVVREAVGVIRKSRLLTALVLAELLWGFGMIAFEVLMPPRLAEVSGGFDDAAAILGPAVGAAWALSAAGAALAPVLVRRWGASWTGFGLRLLHGATVVAMGLAAGPVGLVVAYLATYGVHGATGPVHYGMVHRAVESAHRATVVSANSLASQVGGAASGIALGVLADATSISTAMLVAAGFLAAAAPLYLVGHSTAATAATTSEEPIPINL